MQEEAQKNQLSKPVLEQRALPTDAELRPPSRKRNRIKLPDDLAAAVATIVDSADRNQFSRLKRLNVSRFIRRQLVRPKRRKKRANHRLDQAYQDYKNGMRGVRLRVVDHVPQARPGSPRMHTNHTADGPQAASSGRMGHHD